MLKTKIRKRDIDEAILTLKLQDIIEEISDEKDKKVTRIYSLKQQSDFPDLRSLSELPESQKLKELRGVTPW